MPYMFMLTVLSEVMGSVRVSMDMVIATGISTLWPSAAMVKEMFMSMSTCMLLSSAEAAWALVMAFSKSLPPQAARPRISARQSARDISFFKLMSSTWLF